MKRHACITATLFTMLALAACTNPAGPPGQYGIIKGTIASSSGQPIAGATILVDYTVTATSKSDGTYEVDNVPQAPSTAPAVVSVSASGYQTQTRTDIIVQVGQTTTLNFTLSRS